VIVNNECVVLTKQMGYRLVNIVYITGNKMPKNTIRQQSIVYDVVNIFNFRKVAEQRISAW